MRSFLIFCALLLACLAAGAFLAYPAYLLVHSLQPDWKFHRIASRAAMLLLAVSLIWFFRYLRINNRHDLGFGIEPSRFMRQFGIALLAGTLSMLPVVALLYALDVRIPLPWPQAVASVIGMGLLSGLMIGFIEETLLRGAMHSAIERESGRRAAVLLTAGVYATLHFLGRARIPPDQVGLNSGFDWLAGTLSAFAHPLALFDSFLSLFAVGVLLGLVRIRTGGIAACIGLHAGWVCVINSVRELSVYNAASPWSFLVGSYNGVVGYLVLGWTTLISVVFWMLSRKSVLPVLPMGKSQT